MFGVFGLAERFLRFNWVSRSSRRTLVSFVTLVMINACCMSLFGATEPKVQALGQGVEIVAKVQPVRDVVVNQKQHVIEVISNTYDSVPPSVWLDSVGYKQLAMTSSIETQYQAILTKVPWQTRYGTIYSLAEHSRRRSIIALYLLQNVSTEFKRASIV